MTGISTTHILKGITNASIDGKKTYKAPTYKIDEKLQKKIEQSPLDLDTFIAMEEFATYLPRGKRQLKLNLPELRDSLLSKSDLNQMTDMDGLRSGGLASFSGNNKAPPKKATKLLDQVAINYNIKNKNKLSTNPNPTSFKNTFSLR